MIQLSTDKSSVEIYDNVLHIRPDIEEATFDVDSCFPDTFAFLLNSNGKLVSDDHLVYYNSKKTLPYEYPEHRLYVPDQIRIPIYDNRPCDPEQSVFGERNTSRYSIHFDNIRSDVSKIEFLVYSNRPYKLLNTSIVLSDCKTEFAKYYNHSDVYTGCTLCVSIDRHDDDWRINLTPRALDLDLVEYIKLRQ